MVSSKAVVQLTMTLAGMSARSIPGVAATAVNSGEIVVDGRLTRTTEIEEPFLKGVENCKVEDDTGHYIALTFDTSGVTASAGFDGTAEVFGMVGSSGVEKEEEEGETPVATGNDGRLSFFLFLFDARRSRWRRHAPGSAPHVGRSVR